MYLYLWFTIWIIFAFCCCLYNLIFFLDWYNVVFFSLSFNYLCHMVLVPYCFFTQQMWFQCLNVLADVPSSLHQAGFVNRLKKQFMMEDIYM